MTVGGLAWTIALVVVLGLIVASIAGSLGTGALALWSIGVALLATAVSLWRGQRRLDTVASLWRKK
jgi:hypothetical protein